MGEPSRLVSESVEQDVTLLWRDVRGNGDPQQGLLWRMVVVEQQLASLIEFHKQLTRYVWLTGGTIVLYVFQKVGAALWEMLKSHQLL